MGSQCCSTFVAAMLARPTSSSAAEDCTSLEVVEGNSIQIPDVGVMGYHDIMDAWTDPQPITDATGGYVSVYPKWRNTGRIESIVIRSITISADPGFNTLIEFGLKKVSGQTNWTPFVVQLTGGGGYAESALPAVTYADRTIGLVSAPTADPDDDVYEWRTYMNGQQYTSNWWDAVFGEGYMLVHAERGNTCDDEHTQFVGPYSRHLDEGEPRYRAWPELQFVPGNEPVYNCGKHAETESPTPIMSSSFGRKAIQRSTTTSACQMQIRFFDGHWRLK